MIRFEYVDSYPGKAQGHVPVITPHPDEPHTFTFKLGHGQSWDHFITHAWVVHTDLRGTSRTVFFTELGPYTELLNANAVEFTFKTLGNPDWDMTWGGEGTLTGYEHCNKHGLWSSYATPLHLDGLFSTCASTTCADYSAAAVLLPSNVFYRTAGSNPALGQLLHCMCSCEDKDIDRAMSVTLQGISAGVCQQINDAAGGTYPLDPCAPCQEQAASCFEREACPYIQLENADTATTWIGDYEACNNALVCASCFQNLSSTCAVEDIPQCNDEDDIAAAWCTFTCEAPPTSCDMFLNMTTGDGCAAGCPACAIEYMLATYDFSDCPTTEAPVASTDTTDLSAAPVPAHPSLMLVAATTATLALLAAAF